MCYVLYIYIYKFISLCLNLNLKLKCIEYVDYKLTLMIIITQGGGYPICSNKIMLKWNFTYPCTSIMILGFLIILTRFSIQDMYEIYNLM